MAKKFDLAALMGEAVSKSDTGEMRVEQLPLAEIEENENNTVGFVRLLLSVPIQPH